MPASPCGGRLKAFERAIAPDTPLKYAILSLNGRCETTVAINTEKYPIEDNRRDRMNRRSGIIIPTRATLLAHAGR